MNESKQLCEGVVSRLEDIFTTLHNVDVKAKFKALESFRYLLERYYEFLSQHANHSPIHRLVCRSTVTDKLWQFHKEIDDLVPKLGIAVGSSKEFEVQWQQGREVQIRELSQLANDRKVAISEIKDMEEAVVVLLYETTVNQHCGRFTEQELGIMSDVYKQILTLGKVQAPTIPKWFIPPHEIQCDEAPFSRGSYGTVHRGTWLNSRVVVKRILDDNASAFREEANIWHSLSHPHIVRLHGACHVGTPSFICEYAENGTLPNYLAQGNNKQQTWQKLYEAALGLQFVHERGIVHADLKGNNILVGTDRKAKLTDFGLSTIRTSLISTTERKEGGASRWKAPEVLKKLTNSTSESDIFAFGMCILEIVSGELPWAHLGEEGAVRYHVKNGTLPDKPKCFRDDQWGLVQDMCKFEPTERLKITTVVDKLKEFADEEPITRDSHLPDSQSNTKPVSNSQSSQSSDFSGSSTLSFNSSDSIDRGLSFHRYVVPGIGIFVSDALAKIDDLCLHMHEHKVVCVRVYDRLRYVFDESFQHIQDDQNLGQNRLLFLYGGTIARFLTFLQVHVDKKPLVRLASTMKIMDSIENFHIEIDEIFNMLRKFNVHENTKWRSAWKSDRHKQRLILQRLLSEMHNIERDGLDEVLTMLKFEVDKYNHEKPSEHQLVMDTFYSVVRKSKATVKRIPDWFVPEDEVVFADEPFACGVNEFCHRGNWGNETSVIVKRIINDNSDDHEAFMKQADLWSSLDHPNIQKMHGACHISRPYLIVAEEASYGSFNSYFKQKENRTKRWRLLYEAALGLQYLHKRNVVHGNLNCDSIAVGADEKAKLCDFQFSYQYKLEDTETIRVQPDGIHWKAPECVIYSGAAANPSFESDIYSLGMCILYVLSGELPWGKQSTDEYIKDKILRQQSPNRPDSSKISIGLWQFVKNMFAIDPNQRLPLAQIIEKLKKLAMDEAKEHSAKSSSPCSIGFKTGSQHEREPEPEEALSKARDECETSGSSSTDDSISSENQSEQLAVIKEEIEEELTMREDFQSNSPATTNVEGRGRRKTPLVQKMTALSLILEEYQPICDQLLSRIQHLYDVLERAEQNVPSSSQPTFFTEYEDFVKRVSNFLEHCVQIEVQKNVLLRVASSRKIMKQLQAFHQELDPFVRLLECTESDKEQFSWTQQWKTSEAEFEKRLEELSVSMLSAWKIQLQEPLVMMNFEAEYHSHENSKAHRDLMDRTQKRILNLCSCLATSSVPKWFIPQYEITYEENYFGQGALGTIHHGTWGKGTSVVIRRFNYEGDVTEGVVQRELEIMSNLHHPHVAKLFGGCHLSSRPFIVYEYASHGNLTDFLAVKGHEKMMWRLLYQAALGLYYLHDRGIVHGNLKCSNILIDEGKRAQVADFGFHACRENMIQSQAMQWHTLECRKEKAPSFASDVYALAMCILEAVQGKSPRGCTLRKDEMIARNCVMPLRPANMRSDRGWELVKSMRNVDPTQRPALLTVVAQMEKLARQEEQYEMQIVATNTTNVWSEANLCYCYECNQPNPVQSKFCHECGTQFQPNRK